MIQATIPIIQTLSILEALQRNGISVAKVLRRSRIPPALLESRRSRITQQQFSAFIRAVIRLTQDEFWGLAGTRVSVGSFATACRIATREPTLGTALRAALHQYRLYTDDLTARLSVRLGTARIRIVSRVDDPIGARLIQATFVFFLYGLMCWYAGKRIALQGVSFSFLRSESSEEAIRAFRTEVQFNQPFSEIRFDARALNLKGVQDRQSVESFLRQSPGPLGVAFRDRSSVTERLVRLLRRDVSVSISLGNAAKILAMSPPTLRRKLATEGQNFQSIKDAVRRDAAIQGLQHSADALDLIADRLGFSDVHAFCRAFKRWTGATPGDYRRLSTAS
jgi:AraC-like DNA-binding protein